MSDAAPQLDALAIEAEVTARAAADRLLAGLRASPRQTLEALNVRAQCFTAQRAVLLRRAHECALEGKLPQLLNTWRRTLQLRAAVIGLQSVTPEETLAYLSALASALNAVEPYANE